MSIYKRKKIFCYLLLYGFDELLVTACKNAKSWFNFISTSRTYKKYRNKTNITETLAQTFPVAVVTETGLPDSVTGKFET